MNYPIWEQPAVGLLIAVIAVLHVFISHFAIGGGLFLVLTERKARREADASLLDYVKRHSRFFMLLTLVLGAVTGVGIWFTIALVHPQGTSSLINTFVWGWAIEWTFFMTEIAAAIVYYYGWDRLSARTHMTVGWIYFVSAWLSLFIINGILTYMLTPGGWVANRGFWSGFFNETFWPSLVTRTFVCVGLAGIYALLTLSWSRDAALKSKMAVWAGGYWILPMAIAVPIGLLWYLAAASNAGIPVSEILGADGDGVFGIVSAVLGGTAGAGYPIAQRAARIALLASAILVIFALLVVFVRRSAFGLPSTAAMLVLGQIAFAGGEWVREDLRKPFIIGRYMFVNGVRLPPPEEAPRPPDDVTDLMRDRFTIDALEREGVLRAALWTRVPDGFDSQRGPDPSFEPARAAEIEAAAGRELFKALCFSCHTVDGYVAIRPLVANQSVNALERVLGSLAAPVDEVGDPTDWSDPQLRLKTRLGRRMPPFVGTPAEKRALAVYLARLGGREDAGIDSGLPGGAAVGQQLFEDQCAICHGADADWSLVERLAGVDPNELFDTIGRLPEINDAMAPFEGTEGERRALAEFLSGAVGAMESFSPVELGGMVFRDSCAMCHAADGGWPIGERLGDRDERKWYELIGRLSEINDMMPPFEGSDEERHALAAYLAGLEPEGEAP